MASALEPWLLPGLRKSFHYPEAVNAQVVEIRKKRSETKDGSMIVVLSDSFHTTNAVFSAKACAEWERNRRNVVSMDRLHRALISLLVFNVSVANNTIVVTVDKLKYISGQQYGVFGEPRALTSLPEVSDIIQEVFESDLNTKRRRNLLLEATCPSSQAVLDDLVALGQEDTGVRKDSTTEQASQPKKAIHSPNIVPLPDDYIPMSYFRVSPAEAKALEEIRGSLVDWRGINSSSVGLKRIATDVDKQSEKQVLSPIEEEAIAGDLYNALTDNETEIEKCATPMNIAASHSFDGDPFETCEQLDLGDCSSTDDNTLLENSLEDEDGNAENNGDKDMREIENNEFNEERENDGTRTDSLEDSEGMKVANMEDYGDLNQRSSGLPVANIASPGHSVHSSEMSPEIDVAAFHMPLGQSMDLEEVTSAGSQSAGFLASVSQEEDYDHARKGRERQSNIGSSDSTPSSNSFKPGIALEIGADDDRNEQRPARPTNSERSAKDPNRKRRRAQSGANSKYSPSKNRRKEDHREHEHISTFLDEALVDSSLMELMSHGHDMINSQVPHGAAGNACPHLFSLEDTTLGSDGLPSLDCDLTSPHSDDNEHRDNKEKRPTYTDVVLNTHLEEPSNNQDGSTGVDSIEGMADDSVERTTIVSRKRCREHQDTSEACNVQLDRNKQEHEEDPPSVLGTKQKKLKNAADCQVSSVPDPKQAAATGADESGRTGSHDDEQVDAEESLLDQSPMPFTQAPETVLDDDHVATRHFRTATNRVTHGIINSPSQHDLYSSAESLASTQSDYEEIEDETLKHTPTDNFLLYSPPSCPNNPPNFFDNLESDISNSSGVEEIGSQDVNRYEKEKRAGKKPLPSPSVSPIPRKTSPGKAEIKRNTEHLQRLAGEFRNKQNGKMTSKTSPNLSSWLPSHSGAKPQGREEDPDNQHLAQSQRNRKIQKNARKTQRSERERKGDAQQTVSTDQKARPVSLRATAATSIQQPSIYRRSQQEAQLRRIAEKLTARKEQGTSCAAVGSQTKKYLSILLKPR